MSAFELTVLKVLIPRLQDERTKAVDTVTSGALEPKEYGYSCGYIKACDDVLVICQQVIEDIQKG